MAVFQRNVCQPQVSFTPFFRFLEDVENHSRQQANNQPRCRRSAAPQWQPKFDVRETDANYELYGELPGVDKDNVSIEFVDAETLVIRGHAQRNYTSGTAPAAQLEESPSTSDVSDEEKPKKPHQAIVEDEFESISNESTASSVSGDAAETSPKPIAVAPTAPVNKAKYWLRERSIGEFTRSFNFTSHVDQDSVAASFNNGILSVIVPKVKHQARRIAIN